MRMFLSVNAGERINADDSHFASGSSAVENPPVGR